MPRGRIRSWTDEALRGAVASASSLTDVVRRLGLRPAGGNHRSVAAHVGRLGCDTSHFTTTRQTPAVFAFHHKRRLSLDAVFCEHSVANRTTLRQRAKVHLRPAGCAVCGNPGEHCGRPLALQLDHVNGVADDNRIANLRWLCPNCHSQTDSFSGRSSRRRLVAGPCH